MPFTVTPHPSMPRFTGWKPFSRRQETASALDKRQAQSPVYQQQVTDQTLSNLLDDMRLELDNGLVGLPTMIIDGQQAQLSLNNHDYTLHVTQVTQDMLGIHMRPVTTYKGDEKIFVLESEGDKPKIKMTLCANIHLAYSAPHFMYVQKEKRKKELILRTESPELLQKATAVFEQLARLALENPAEQGYYREVQQIKADRKLYF